MSKKDLYNIFRQALKDELSDQKILIHSELDNLQFYREKPSPGGLPCTVKISTDHPGKIERIVCGIHERLFYFTEIAYIRTPENLNRQVSERPQGRDAAVVNEIEAPTLADLLDVVRNKYNVLL